MFVSGSRLPSQKWSKSKVKGWVKMLLLSEMLYLVLVLVLVVKVPVLVLVLDVL